MATNTNNLNLIKPDQNDFYNVEDFNGNFQKIDDFTARTDNPHKVTAEQVHAVEAGLPITVNSSTTIAETILNASLKGIYWGNFHAAGCSDLPSNNWDYGVEFKSIGGDDFLVIATKKYGEIYYRQYNAFDKAWLTEWNSFLPLSGGNLTGALSFNESGAIQQFNSTLELISNVVGSSTYDRIHFALNANDDIANALVLVKIANDVASSYKLYGEHNKPKASDVASGKFSGAMVAADTTNANTSQIRNIAASTSDLTAGTSALATGNIYLVYE